MKSSSSEILQREQLSAYQRWELASLATATEPDVRADAAHEAELVALRTAAAAEGKAAGYAAGIAEAAADRARLARLLDRLDVAAVDHEQRLMDEVLDLALVLGRQLVGEALAVRRELVLPVVAAGLQQLPQSVQRVDLVLNPEDLEIVRTFLAGRPPGQRCDLRADATVAPGGCRIETEQCEVDATLPTRWRRLLAGLGRTDDWLEPD